MLAALAAHEAGASTVVIERNEHLGGILRQCIHPGFGLTHFKEELTGPEYAQRFINRVREAGIDVMPGSMALGIDEGGREDAAHSVTVMGEDGMVRLTCRSVVLAMGCRERTRFEIKIPGSRPAGVYTAGLAQRYINIENLRPGHRVVILGSGDIGLIMARRCALEGLEVEGVYELMPYANGLHRNVKNCLEDFDIPLHLSTTVTRVIGRNRVEGVEVTRVDENLAPIPGTERIVACDTLLLSVGLIPENEVGAQAGIALDPVTNGAVTDPFLQTSVPGIFACGNSRRVMDLADFVTVQGQAAGANAARFVRGEPLAPMPPETANAMAKGLPQPGVTTCILCPKGCQVTWHAGEGARGNGCPKGADYARQEAVDPRRVLTTTLKGADGRLIPVKTSGGVPRDCLLACMETLRHCILPAASLSVGQTALQDPFGLGVDVVVTGSPMEMNYMHNKK